MTKFVILAIAFVYLINGSSCHVISVRDAPATTPDALSDLIKQTQDTAVDLNAKFLKLWGVETNEQLTNVIEQQSKSFVERIQELLPQLQKEASENSAKVKEVMGDINTKLTTTITEMHKKSPEIVTGGKEISSNLATLFQNGVSAVADEFSNLGKKLSEDEQLGNKLKEVVSKIVSTAQDTAHEVAKSMDSAIQEKKTNP